MDVSRVEQILSFLSPAVGLHYSHREEICLVMWCGNEEQRDPTQQKLVIQTEKESAV